MKKRKIFLAIIVLLFFAGGFLSGLQYANYNVRKDIAERPNIQKKEQERKSKPNTVPNQKILENNKSKVLIGYVQDFRDPNLVEYSNMTHIIFSFAHPTKEGGLLLNEGALSNLRTMVKKAHEQDKKALLAVGGWYHILGGESYDYFKIAISNSTSRANLINEIMRITEREKLDGIDIDFEHPRTTEDAKHLALFIKLLGEKLDAKNKELTIAVNSKVHSVTGTEITSVVYEPSMFHYVDYVNIMAYDGQWDGEYNAANLSPYSHIENIVDYWINLFDNNALSREKLVLGVPFYAQPEDISIKQISYATIVKNNPKNAGRDKINLNGTTYHYNGITTITRKTKLALNHGFGGMMLWEAGHDATGPHSLTRLISKMLDNVNPQI